MKCVTCSRKDKEGVSGVYLVEEDGEMNAFQCARCCDAQNGRLWGLLHLAASKWKDLPIPRSRIERFTETRARRARDGGRS